jgi:hypothetical protein
MTDEDRAELVALTLEGRLTLIPASDRPSLLTDLDYAYFVFVGGDPLYCYDLAHVLVLVRNGRTAWFSYEPRPARD